MVIITT